MVPCNPKLTHLSHGLSHRRTQTTGHRFERFILSTVPWLLHPTLDIATALCLYQARWIPDVDSFQHVEIATSQSVQMPVEGAISSTERGVAARVEKTEV